MCTRTKPLLAGKCWNVGGFFLFTPTGSVVVMASRRDRGGGGISQSGDEHSMGDSERRLRQSETRKSEDEEDTNLESDSDEDLAADKPTFTKSSPSNRKYSTARGRGSRGRGGTPRVTDNEEQPSLRDLNNMAYSRSALHTYKSRGFHGDQGGGGSWSAGARSRSRTARYATQDERNAREDKERFCLNWVIRRVLQAIHRALKQVSRSYIQISMELLTTRRAKPQSCYYPALFSFSGSSTTISSLSFGSSLTVGGSVGALLDSCTGSSCSDDLTNRASRLKGFEFTVVVADIGCGWSLRCPGLGSSSSSTRPSTFGSDPSARGIAVDPGASREASMSGEGGGLRDCERRASSCRKGIGENIGVDGMKDKFVFPIVSSTVQPQLTLL